MNLVSLWPKDLIIAMIQCIWETLINYSITCISHLEAFSPVEGTQLLVSTSTPLVNMLLGGGDENWAFALNLLAL